ncbi:glycoside hydrolase family 97 protein [Parvularcula sp. LCG005]|uniref:glycoside hydrolase family 97 protein n=1 Tax=Parvularcula sp. LCG005 TaxID=3078805 RepID=UPI002942903C|nr:glycoside hydrolase family 97 protein [Parvularcula sp. LCG005]WOI54228.1 glycoside hydrolase family 97 protein [Parvularcula sp. LCG005]
MNRVLATILTSTMLSTPALAADVDLTSPDGSIAVSLGEGKELTLEVSVDGTVVLSPSPIGMTIDGSVYGRDVTLGTAKRDSVDETLTPVVREKAASVRNHYNAVTVEIGEGVDLEVRAYDNGVAWRWTTELGGEVTVGAEQVDLKFAGDFPLHFPREDGFLSHNERLYEKTTLSPLKKADLASLPLLVQAPTANLLLTETDLRDYAGMWVNGGRGNMLSGTFPKAVAKEHMADDRNPVIDAHHDYIAKTDGTRTFPWRILGVARQDKDLLTNQLAWQLAPASEIGDASWIKPGQVAWDWWNMNNIFGVDFRAGVNTETYKYFIDFASENGIEYVILDEGWYELGDIMKVSPDVDVPALMAYAKEKDVKIVLWAIWHALDEKLEEALDQFAEWGAAGIKVDFMQRDDQWMVDYYWRVAKAAADRELLVDYHGAHKPAGLRGAYPNVISYEGVKGLENMKWDEKPDPDHNTTLPFIRMVAGPMDYTPGAMTNVKAEEFAPMFSRPMSIGTRAHQVALYVIFESPLQMLADSPSHLRQEQETVDFITDIPTVWDETVALDGKIGDFVTMARRSGDDWFVGVLTDETAREMEVTFDFIDQPMRATVFRDGINADRYGNDYKVETVEVSPGDTLTVSLAPGGGWAAKLSPIAN